MRSMLAALAAGIVTACASPGSATSEDLRAHWAALTATDVEAAHRLIAEDHPAMSDEIADESFRERMAAGRELALSRAREVSSIEGYFATMAGLANAAGDKHVWSRSFYTPDPVQWAGLIVSLRGERYVVIEHDGATQDSSLAGASLVSCDGVDADTLAYERLGRFRAVWSVGAQRVQQAPYLLIDDGNPLAPRPGVCVFDRAGARLEHTMNWRSISRADLRPRVRPALNRGAPGYGVRDFAGGMWISLQGLGDAAVPVVEAVRTNAERLRAAPIVVLDLRGNGGGNSSLGRQIAEVLFGEARIGAALGEGVGENGCSGVWRVSPRNLAQMQEYLRRFGPIAPEFAAEIERQLAGAEVARAAGRDFTGPTTCAPGGDASSTSADAPTALARGRIVLLTDNACFSSCLLVTNDFRRLGALHVGQTTDANTHYFEVREERMPSGLSMFSTLQAFSPGSPQQVGPFTPTHSFGGDMADTAALEAWVIELAR